MSEPHESASRTAYVVRLEQENRVLCEVEKHARELLRFGQTPRVAWSAAAEARYDNIEHNLIHALRELEVLRKSTTKTE